MAKYYNDLIAILDDDLYFEMFEKRGVKFLKIVRSKDFSPLSGVELQIKSEHHWAQGDSFWKLAQRYYRDPKLWWALAIINKKPTDNHCSIGDIIYIPKDIYKVVEAMR